MSDYNHNTIFQAVSRKAGLHGINHTLFYSCYGIQLDAQSGRGIPQSLRHLSALAETWKVFWPHETFLAGINIENPPIASPIERGFQQPFPRLPEEDWPPDQESQNQSVWLSEEESPSVEQEYHEQSARLTEEESPSEQESQDQSTRLPEEEFPPRFGLTLAQDASIHLDNMLETPIPRQVRSSSATTTCFEPLPTVQHSLRRGTFSLVNSSQPFTTEQPPPQQETAPLVASSQDLQTEQHSSQQEAAPLVASSQSLPTVQQPSNSLPFSVLSSINPLYAITQPDNRLNPYATIWQPNGLDDRTNHGFLKETYDDTNSMNPSIQNASCSNIEIHEGKGKQPQREHCENCDMEGHSLRQCVDPVDKFGFISGCPFCNTKAHLLEHCFMKPGKELIEWLLVKTRHNRPPIRWSYDIRAIPGFWEQPYRPWTRDFSLRQAGRFVFSYDPDSTISKGSFPDPSWNYPDTIPSQAYPSDNEAYQQPLFVENNRDNIENSLFAPGPSRGAWNATESSHQTRLFPSVENGISQTSMSHRFSKNGKAPGKSRVEQDMYHDYERCKFESNIASRFTTPTASDKHLRKQLIARSGFGSKLTPSFESYEKPPKEECVVDPYNTNIGSNVQAKVRHQDKSNAKRPSSMNVESESFRRDVWKGVVQLSGSVEYKHAPTKHQKVLEKAMLGLRREIKEIEAFENKRDFLTDEQLRRVASKEARVTELAVVSEQLNKYSMSLPQPDSFYANENINPIPPNPPAKSKRQSIKPVHILNVPTASKQSNSSQNDDERVDVLQRSSNHDAPNPYASKARQTPPKPVSSEERCLESILTSEKEQGPTLNSPVKDSCTNINHASTLSYASKAAYISPKPISVEKHRGKPKTILEGDKYPSLGSPMKNNPKDIPHASGSYAKMAAQVSPKLEPRKELRESNKVASKKEQGPAFGSPTISIPKHIDPSAISHAKKAQQAPPEPGSLRELHHSNKVSSESELFPSLDKSTPELKAEDIDCSPESYCSQNVEQIPPGQESKPSLNLKEVSYAKSLKQSYTPPPKPEPSKELWQSRRLSTEQQPQPPKNSSTQGSNSKEIGQDAPTSRSSRSKKVKSSPVASIKQRSSRNYDFSSKRGNSGNLRKLSSASAGASVLPQPLKSLSISNNKTSVFLADVNTTSNNDPMKSTAELVSSKEEADKQETSTFGASQNTTTGSAIDPPELSPKTVVTNVALPVPQSTTTDNPSNSILDKLLDPDDFSLSDDDENPPISTSLDLLDPNYFSLLDDDDDDTNNQPSPSDFDQSPYQSPDFDQSFSDSDNEDEDRGRRHSSRWSTTTYVPEHRNSNFETLPTK